MVLPERARTLTESLRILFAPGAYAVNRRMPAKRLIPRPTASWLFVGALFVLCASLGYLQYRWIGEVSIAARDRMRTALQVSLVRLSQDFNSEISTSCRGLLHVVQRSSSDSQ